MICSKCQAAMIKCLAVLILAGLFFSLPWSRLFCHMDPLPTQGNLKVLVLEGTPYERGLRW